MIQARAVLALSVVVIDEETGAVVGLDGCSKFKWSTVVQKSWTQNGFWSFKRRLVNKTELRVSNMERSRKGQGLCDGTTYSA